MMKLRYPLLFLLLTGCLILAFYLTQPKRPEHADYYPVGRDINNFQLIDADNKRWQRIVAETGFKIN